MRREKLNKGEVNRLFADGASAKERWLIARALANGLPHSRFAAIAPHKSGCAVFRNRLKRRLRAAWAAARAELPAGYDFAVIARREVADCEFPQLREMLARALRKLAGL